MMAVARQAMMMEMERMMMEGGKAGRLEPRGRRWVFVLIELMKCRC